MVRTNMGTSHAASIVTKLTELPINIFCPRYGIKRVRSWDSAGSLFPRRSGIKGFFLGIQWGTIGLEIVLLSGEEVSGCSGFPEEVIDA